jgi:arginyl-tRNA synthetase
MARDLSELTAEVIKDSFDLEMQPIFTRPEAGHGDFSTNVAMQLAGKVGKPPREIAEAIKVALEEKGDLRVSVAGPGFINIILSDNEIFTAALESTSINKSLENKVIVAEYSDPNPFKTLHAGHLYASLVGDAIANLLENAGAEVHRVNFGGDVGLHVAKSMWAIIKELGGEQPEQLHEIPDEQKLDWITRLYVQGNTAYEENSQFKQEIIDINKRVYSLHETNDRESGFAQIYWTCRQWSYDGFEDLYKRLGMVPFEKYYPESVTTQPGVEAVHEGLKRGVFKESDGAVVYPGEEKGLHTRVFINSEGLPTYEAKDLGLSLCKWQDYHFDQSFIITGNDIQEYMKVVIAAVGDFNPEAAGRTLHRTHGQVKLAGGVKMSSRQGNVLKASDILEAAYEAAQQTPNGAEEAVILGAVRYSFLRIRIGGDIIYTPEESVSLEGNSGPYLQYALVRARSILRKVEGIEAVKEVEELDKYERNLARALSLYSEVFDQALADYSPHHICNYLYDLAVTFNRFYENSRIIGDDRASLRLALLKSYEKTLSHGLSVLGMPQPEKM